MKPNAEGSDERIPVYLITGFLGAGKTTLVNRLLAGSLGRGAGLLVNDFGDVVVDAGLLRRRSSPLDDPEAPDIFEVAGGSIFCSCKTDNFALGLRTFANIRPARLFVEASGMSDPSGLDKILADYRLAADFRLARVICLADAVRTPRMMENLPALTLQIEAADVVLVNKCDLADEADITAFEERIRRLNPGAEVVRTIQAELSADDLAAPASAHRRGRIASCSTPSNRPSCLQFEAHGMSRSAVEAFLHDHLSETWRIKGWIQTADGAWWYVSDNAGSLEWTPDPLPDGMIEGLTVITPPGGDTAFSEAWEAFRSA